LHDSAEDSNFGFLLKLGLADIENLGTRDGLVLEHIVVDQVNLLARERVLDLAEMGLEGLR
jgi:hypothetical protein